MQTNPSTLLGQYVRESSALEAFGTLGVIVDPRVSLQRLRVQSGVLRTAIANGEVTVPTELMPDKLDAHAKTHESILVKRDAAIASRQAQSVRLADARAKTTKALRRVRGIVIGFQGMPSLPDYGFKLPAMPTLPRELRKKAKSAKKKTQTATKNETSTESTAPAELSATG